MNRFLKYTTQEEPALTIGVIAAAVLALLSKFVLLTDDDLTILGPVVVIIITTLVRQSVFSPATVAKLTGKDQGDPK